ncbi:MAG: hypothetical protein ABIU20_02170 [Blastocatellia bacterium]
MLQFASHNYIAVVITISLKRAGIVLAVLMRWLVFQRTPYHGQIDRVGGDGGGCIDLLSANASGAVAGSNFSLSLSGCMLRFT